MVNFFIATESRYYAVEPNCDPLSTTFDKVTCPAPDQIFVLRDKNGLPECAYNLWTGLLVSNMKQGMVCEGKAIQRDFSENMRELFLGKEAMTNVVAILGIYFLVNYCFNRFKKKIK